MVVKSLGRRESLVAIVTAVSDLLGVVAVSPYFMRPNKLIYNRFNKWVEYQGINYFTCDARRVLKLS